jgi:uncharacterized NAD(P)/FAD-binding protein YdhS
MTERSTVAVVGAGFSGLLTALRLLLAPEGPAVTLIEKGPRFGRGAAYSTGNPRHLLNVRATNMSALVEQPSHFIDWLAAAGVAAPDRAFVTRDRYGQYLQSLLREATAETASGRLVLEHDAVTGLEREGDRWRLGLAMGRTLTADAVVLAMGNLPPAPPEGADPALLASDRYVADPWAWPGPAAGANGEILLLGTGLTSVDVALSIDERIPSARMFALSRHGLTPRSHGEISPAGQNLAGAPAGSPMEVLREVRRRAAADWRGAIDGVRPHVQGVWRGWSLAERRRFLRHARPWWNVYRHRLAPEVDARLSDLRKPDPRQSDRPQSDLPQSDLPQSDLLQSGRLVVAAGRIVRMTLTPDGVEVAWRPRGRWDVQIRRVAQVVNCTGPRGVRAGGDDPLLAELIAAGLVRPDACDLGVDVDSRSRAVGASGAPNDSLFAVGPLTRGQFYEITSVPDIRLQAADCADSILNMLALKDRDRSAGASGAGQGERLASDLAAFIEDSIAELDVELGSLKFARRVRGAWELRGRRAALGEIALWLDARRTGDGKS